MSCRVVHVVTYHRSDTDLYDLQDLGHEVIQLELLQHSVKSCLLLKLVALLAPKIVGNSAPNAYRSAPRYSSNKILTSIQHTSFVIIVAGIGDLLARLSNQNDLSITLGSRTATHIFGAELVATFLSLYRHRLHYSTIVYHTAIIQLGMSRY